MELFIILFDEKLNIIEIRNTKLINQNVKSEYFDIINEKIKNTQGLWKKKKESKWYYYYINYTDIPKRVRYYTREYSGFPY